MEQPENLQTSSAADIKAQAKKDQEGIILELPSGLKIRIRRPSLPKMLKEGVVPSDLVSAAIRQVQGEKSMNLQQIQDSIRVMEVILRQAILEPRVVESNPQDNEITIDDLSDDDRGFAFSYVQSGATDLRPFRS